MFGIDWNGDGVVNGFDTVMDLMILMLSQYFFAHINKKCDIMKSRR